MVSVAILVLIATFSHIEWKEFQRSSSGARQTREILETTENLLEAMLDSETGQRGYLLTGREEYLEPYTQAAKTAPVYLSKLEALTSGKSNQRDRVASLMTLVPEKLLELRETLDLYKSQGAEAALDLMLTDRGRAAMESIRRVCAQIDSEEYSGLIQESERAQQRVQQSQLASVAGSAALVVFLIFAIRDIHNATERRERLILELSASNKRAEAALFAATRSNEELQQFAYAASHDLKEPLRMVKSFVQLLARKYDGRLDEQATEFIHYAAEGAQRMDSLLEALLEYSRLGHVAEKPPQPVNLETVLDGTLTSLRAAIDESAAVVTHDPLPAVMAEDLHMQQLFQNLISNAIKYRGEEAPRIHLSAKRQGDEWMCAIRDNGIGIDPKYGSKIFGIFKRLHGSEYPGTGIGLASCKKIVERYRGQIWVESQPGTGSTFFFTLPDISPREAGNRKAS